MLRNQPALTMHTNLFIPMFWCGIEQSCELDKLSSAWQLAVMSADSSYQQSCTRCGARYEVIVTSKIFGAHDERVVCACGWPLKDWIRVKAHIFKRATAPSRPHRAVSVDEMREH